jgi:hypothetical protein
LTLRTHILEVRSQLSEGQFAIPVLPFFKLASAA